MTALIWKLFTTLTKTEIFFKQIAGALWRKQASIHEKYLATVTAWNADHAPPPTTKLAFDTDSITIGVDTHVSATMSGRKDLFEDLTLADFLDICHGFGGASLCVGGIGTFTFQMQDDEGATHTIRVPNSLYIPRMENNLLCPQHWAQQANDHFPNPEGTYVKTLSDCSILFWDQRRYSKTVPLDPGSNVPAFRSSPGIVTFQTFCTTLEAFDAHLILPESHEVVDQVPDSLERRRERERDADFIADEDLLVGPEDAWSVDSSNNILYKVKNDPAPTMSTDDATVKKTTASPSGTLSHVSPSDPCPLHPLSQHKWGECSQYRSQQHQQQRGPLMYNLAPDLEENYPHWTAKEPQAELM